MVATHDASASNGQNSGGRGMSTRKRGVEIVDEQPAGQNKKGCC
jgi:hypothetical protein